MMKVIRKTIFQTPKDGNRAVNLTTVSQFSSCDARAQDGWELKTGAGFAGSPYFRVECALAVRDPRGLIVVWIDGIVDNSSSIQICERIVPFSSPVVDRRYTNREKIDKAWGLIKSAHAYAITPLEQLALSLD